MSRHNNYNDNNRNYYNKSNRNNRNNQQQQRVLQQQGHHNNGGLLKAECFKMCPDDEYELRMENNLVNALEKTTISNSSKIEYNLVKEYSRPAAGKIIRSIHLRPVDVLVKTTEYLVRCVYNRGDVDFFLRYEFLFDRFRSIRQDLIIQRLNARNAQVLFIYKTILKFYLLADYKLCTTSAYDSYMNNQHFHEVLNGIVSSFDINNQNHNQKHDEAKSHELSDLFQRSLTLTNKPVSVENDEELFVSVYMLINLNNHTNLNQVLQRYPPRIAFKTTTKDKGKIYQQSVSIVKHYVQRDHLRLFKVYKQLPLILQLTLHQKIPSIEIELLKMYNVAFSAKNSKYPAENLIRITLLNSKFSLHKYPELIQLDESGDCIEFSKTKASLIIKEERERLNLIDEKLKTIKESDFLIEDLTI